MDGLTLEPNLKVYWLPGCSSCVKVKEHLDKLQVPFQSVNVAARNAYLALEAYWNNGEGEFQVRPMTLDMDLNSSLQLLDRSSWHSAQHLRQVVSALQREQVTLSPAWEEGFYRGLNVPDKLWE